MSHSGTATHLRARPSCQPSLGTETAARRRRPTQAHELPTLIPVCSEHAKGEPPSLRHRRDDGVHIGGGWRIDHAPLLTRELYSAVLRGVRVDIREVEHGAEGRDVAADRGRLEGQTRYPLLNIGRGDRRWGRGPRMSAASSSGASQDSSSSVPRGRLGLTCTPLTTRGTCAASEDRVQPGARLPGCALLRSRRQRSPVSPASLRVLKLPAWTIGYARPPSR